MKTVKYILQTSSILISIFILLGSIIGLLKNYDLYHANTMLQELNIDTLKLSKILQKYAILASSIAIIFMSISLGFNNKIIYILSIVISALSINYIGVAAGIFGIILVNKQKNSPSTDTNYDLKIGGGNLALFIIQFCITIPLAIGVLSDVFYNGIRMNPWLMLLIIPLLLVIIFIGIFIIAVEIDLLIIAGLLAKQKWVFRIAMIGSFATLQILSGIAAINVMNKNK